MRASPRPKSSTGNDPGPFVVKDSALIAIATGVRASTAGELLDHARHIHAGSIYYHFWGGLLRPRFADREYNNDFATWARLGLHDAELAERLGIIDPGRHRDDESLRRELTEVLAEYLAEDPPRRRSDPMDHFHFVRSQIVQVDAREHAADPASLGRLVPRLSLGSIFFHFVDARRRNEQNQDDFRVWLRAWGPEFEGLRRDLADLDPYFLSLGGLRTRLAECFAHHAGSRRA